MKVVEFFAHHILKEVSSSDSLSLSTDEAPDLSQSYIEIKEDLQCSQSGKGDSGHPVEPEQKDMVRGCRTQYQKKRTTS